MEWVLLISVLLNVVFLNLLKNETDDHIRTLEAFSVYVDGDKDRAVRIIAGKEE